METASWEKPVLLKFSTAPYAHGTRDQWLWLQSQVLHPVEYTVEQSGRHLSSFPSSKHQMRTISRKNGSIHPAGVCKYKETPPKDSFYWFFQKLNIHSRPVICCQYNLYFKNILKWFVCYSPNCFNWMIPVFTLKRPIILTKRTWCPNCEVTKEGYTGSSVLLYSDQDTVVQHPNLEENSKQK